MMESHLQEEYARVLVVDDEKVVREILNDFLSMEGLQVRTAENGEAALAELQRGAYDLVISDLKMPRMGGLDLLEKINELNIDVLTVIMTGFGTVETAIKAMKRGAYDYVLKPFKIEEVVHIVQRGLERRRLQRENIHLKEALSLYKISEAMSQSLSLGPILDLVVTAALDELSAEFVTLLLPHGEGGALVERIQRGRNGNRVRAKPRIDELLACHARDVPVIAHGARIQRFLERTDDAVDVRSFCSIPLRVNDRVLGMINAYSCAPGHKFSEGQRKMMVVLCSRAAVAIENARLYENLLNSNQRLGAANRSLEENFQQTIVGFVNALEENDRYTRGHSERVSVYSRLIAEAMELSQPDVDRVALSAKIHDIGKIGIGTEKLNKPGKLTRDEIRTFRSHPEKGRRILEPVPFLRELIPGAFCHHERYDGTGYPQRLKGEEIPLLGRIISVADAYDAMISDRAYRKALPYRAAIEQLEQGAGTQFDAKIVDVFIRVLERQQHEHHGQQTSFPAIVAAGQA